MNCAWPRAMWLVTSDPIVFRSPSFKVVLVALIAINAEKIRNRNLNSNFVFGSIKNSICIHTCTVPTSCLQITPLRVTTSLPLGLVRGL